MITMAEKKLASDELTAWRDPAREESIVSKSFPKRLSIRPWDHERWIAVQHDLRWRQTLRGGVMESERRSHNRNEQLPILRQLRTGG